MFETRELATVLAALLFWSEEITPGGRALAASYLRRVKLGRVEPLDAAEIRLLSARLHREFGAP